jgi:hypothetical protein
MVLVHQMIDAFCWNGVTGTTATLMAGSDIGLSAYRLVRQAAARS